MNLSQYQQSVRPLFAVAQDRSVLEIGPFWGQHTTVLESYGPQTVTLLEPNSDAAALLAQKFDYTVIVEDVYHYLRTVKHYDVVLLCGVLYHLHSPLYLLELIANNVNPEYIITETFLYEGLTAHYAEEPLNIPGSRYAKAWRTAGYNCSLTAPVMTASMRNLGYAGLSSITHPVLDNCDDFYKTKANSTMTVWRRL